MAPVKSCPVVVLAGNKAGDQVSKKNTWFEFGARDSSKANSSLLQIGV